MRPLAIAYLVLAGVSVVLGDVTPQLSAVGVPEAWIALVGDTTSSVVKYVGALGAAGILAVPMLPTLREALAGKGTG